MGYTPLGQLPNAPLAYVLGVIDFDPRPDTEKHIAALRESLLADYPRYQLPSEVRIELEGGIPNSQNRSTLRHEFSSADNRLGIILTDRKLAFHATAYTKYEAFIERLTNSFMLISDELKHLFMRRIGLRYIDAIIPDEEKSPDDYVTPGLRNAPKLSLEYSMNAGVSISEFRLERGTFVIRYATGPGRIRLPPDLDSLSLAKPSILQRNIDDHQRTGILDFDRFMSLEEPFDLASIKRYMDLLHNDHSVAFREITTATAKNAWSLPTKDSI